MKWEKKVRNYLAYTCNKSYIHVKAKQRKFILQHDSGIKVLTSNIWNKQEAHGPHRSPEKSV